jgi:NAD(P)H-nitrite reductase large subunit
MGSLQRIVIVGASAAGLSALEAVRAHDRDSQIVIVSKEGRRPYSRVQLPYVLKGRTGFENLFIRDPDFARDLGADFADGRVVGLDEDKRLVHLSGGRALGFDRLLIATGSVPATPAIAGLDTPGVHHVWTLEDAEAVKSALAPDRRVLIVGAGFIAMQVAWAAVLNGLSVTLAVRSVILRKDLDLTGRTILEQRMRARGVEIRQGAVPERIERTASGALVVHTPGHDPAEVDLVVIAAGVAPNTGFLRGDAIARDPGILVDAHMQTSVPGIYAAGDVAAGPTAFGEAHVVHSLWPSAVEQGKVAGANMAGHPTLYRGSLNMNVTELFGLTVASMGRFGDGHGDQVWEYGGLGGDDYMKVVLDDGVPQGALVVGRPDSVSVLGLLRPLIREQASGLYVALWRPMKFGVKRASC